MTLIAERFYLRPPLVDMSAIVKPEVRQLREYESAAMQIRMRVPEDWREVIERADHVRLAPDVEPGLTFSQLDFYHDPHPYMPAEDMAMNRMSNEIETVQKPVQAIVAGRPAWLTEICNHPTRIIDASKKPGAIRTECVFDDPDGTVRTIVLSSASAEDHLKEKPMFMRMLSSLRLSKQ